MRLATIARPDGSTVACVLDGDDAVAISGHADVGALLATPGWRALAATALAAGTRAPLDPATLLRPVLAPGATVCVGANYLAHIHEMGRQPPAAPALFAKLPRALAHPGQTLPLGDRSPALDYEGELVAVIGTRARDVDPADALAHVAGYTLMNDLSARDLQRRSLQWFAGKNLEQSTAVGPWVVTADELGDVAEHTLETRVNGELRQSSSLSDLVFDVATLVADLSRILTLEPGDLLATGTPGGVGDARDPKAYLQAGDLVEITVDGLGTLTTRIG